MSEIVHCVRLAARADALDRLDAPDGSVLRLAPDEALVLDVSIDEIGIDDPDAIVVSETGYVGIRSDVDTVSRFLGAGADFVLVDRDPGLTQGMVAELPIKIWRVEDRCLVMAPTPFADELAERFGAMT